MKLSLILSIFVSTIYGFTITVPDSGIAGDSISVDFTIEDGDPTKVDLLLFGTNSSSYTISNDMKVTPQNVVKIPVDVVPDTYNIVATEVGNDKVEYKRSNDIVIFN